MPPAVKSIARAKAPSAAMFCDDDRKASFACRQQPDSLMLRFVCNRLDLANQVFDIAADRWPMRYHFFTLVLCHGFDDPRDVAWPFACHFPPFPHGWTVHRKDIEYA